MPPEIRELMQQAEQLMAYITQNSSAINAETQRALAQFLQETNDFIQEFSGELPPIEEIEAQQAEVANEVTSEAPAVPLGGPVPELDRAPHESSNINALKYDPNKKQLFIKFMGKDTADSGPVYSYQDVPQNVFDVISRGGVAPLTSGKNKYHQWHRGITPSHGASVSALIKKGGYSYRRMG
jgi:hypothetical protein